MIQLQHRRLHSITYRYTTDCTDLQNQLELTDVPYMVPPKYIYINKTADTNNAAI